jgi:hypothetical protein
VPLSKESGIDHNAKPTVSDALQVECGLRLVLTDSASTLPISSLARFSFSFEAACSLIRLYRTFCIEGFVPGHCQPATLQLLPAGATVAGWDVFLPLDRRALSRRSEPLG